MANLVFNIALGRIVEKVTSDATQLGVLLLQTAEAADTLRDYDTVAAILAGSNTECNFTNYARKTGITGTITVDDTNNRTDIDIPDQTFTSAGGASNNSVVLAVVYYEDSASDAGRIPFTMQDFVVTTDGNDLVLQVAAAGFYRTAGE